MKNWSVPPPAAKPDQLSTRSVPVHESELLFGEVQNARAGAQVERRGTLERERGERLAETVGIERAAARSWSRRC